MAELQIGRIVLGSCATNCYYIHKEGKTETVVIDPADRGTYIYEKMKEYGIAKRTVQEAKKIAEIEAYKKGKIWYWHMEVGDSI